MEKLSLYVKEQIESIIDESNKEFDRKNIFNP